MRAGKQREIEGIGQGRNKDQEGGEKILKESEGSEVERSGK